MQALSERNVLKASEYYITFCNRFINWGNIISSTISKYFAVINLELFTKQWLNESIII